MTKRSRSFVSLFVALTLILGSLTLAGCSGSNNEQDNCYGEDIPVVNESK